MAYLGKKENTTVTDLVVQIRHLKLADCESKIIELPWFSKIAVNDQIQYLDLNIQLRHG